MDQRLHKSNRKGLRRVISFCVALATVFALLPALFASGGLQAEAMDYSKLESTYNRWQYYFLRTVTSISLKDAYDNGVLASITAGQALYEGGAGGYPISIIGQNHFGIKAFYTWQGKVFEQYSKLVYESYADAKLMNPDGSFWRAYDTWEEGIADHSALFLGDTRYTKVLAASNYKEAAYAIADSGYAGSDPGDYAPTLIGIIERYDFQDLDDVTVDSNGVYGLYMDVSRATLDVGDTLSLTATAYPSPKGKVDITWSSDRPEVASVDQNGKVTALRQGYTLITATYNGKEAACVIEVDANAYNIDRTSTARVFKKPDLSSDALGKLSPGQPVKINSKELFYGPDGTAFYAVSASPNSSDGQPVSGYTPASSLYAGDGLQMVVGTDSTILYQSVGDSLTIPLTIYAEELKNKPVAWSSSDDSVVTVDQNGKINCVSEGVAVISITIDDKLALTVTVYVGSSALKTLVATTGVNLRTAPSTNSTVLGVIQQGQEVKLVNDPGNGWYRLLAVIGGHMMEGYASASYFKPAEGNPGTNPGTPNPPSPTPGGDGPTVTYQKGRVNVDDSLNVRDSASTSGKRVAKLKNNDEVIILETVNTADKSYPVWYRIRFTDNGETAFGYVAANFIIITGTVTETAPGGLSSRYGLEELYITSIPAGTTLATFQSNCYPTVRVYRENGKELSDRDVIRSGDTVCVYDGKEVSYVRLAVVTGDVDGNGAVNSLDYLLVKRTALNTFELQSARERAARVSGRSTIGAGDYMLIKRAVLGTYKLA